MSAAAPMLAALLRRRKHDVVERWARRVLEDPRVPQANRLPQPTLHDHVPSLLDRLCERLEHAGSEPHAAEALGALLGDEHDSHAHAAQRASLGYDVNAASREIGHLRLVLLQVCAEEKLDLDITADIVLHAALDEVMATLMERLERMSVTMARKHAEEGGARLLAAEQRQNAQLRALAEAAVAVHSAATLQDALQALTDRARSVIGAHQAVTSTTVNGSWAQSVNAVSMSERYMKWASYADAPDGSGIYAWVCENNRPIRMTQADLEAHPRWRGFGVHAPNHPPMRGWLAVPLVARDGRNLGLVQLSDRFDGEFSPEDEAILLQLAQLGAVAIENAQLYAAAQAARAEADAQRSALHGLFTQAPVAIAVWRGPEHVFELANPLYLRVFGRENVVGRTVRDVFPEPELAQSGLWQIWDGVYATGKAFAVAEYEVHFDRSGSGRREPAFFAFTLEAVRAGDGSVAGLMAVAVDVTEQVLARRKVEKLAAEVAQQHNWTEALLDQMPAPLLLVEPDTARVLFANKAADRMAGGEFPKGKPSQEYDDVYYCTDAQGRRIQADEMPGVRAARGEKLSGFEMDWHTPQGRTSIIVQSDEVPEQFGHARTVVIAFQDITSRKRAEERLRLLADIGTALQSAVLDYDSTLRTVAKFTVPWLADWCLVDIIESDGSIRRVEVAHRDEQLNDLADEMRRFAPSADSPTHPAARAVAMRAPVVIADFDEAAADATGDHLATMRAVSARSLMSVPLLNRDRVLGVLTFISAGPSGRRFEASDVAFAEELARRAASAIESARLFKLAQLERSRAEGANRAKDEFLATVSHELRTPLGAILGWARLLRTGNLTDDKRARALETIERNAKVQVQLIEDVLDVSRIITGKLRLNVVPVEMMRVVEAAIETVRPAADAKSVRLQVLLDPDAGVTLGDPDRLQQIVWNLLTNAVKFTPKGGRVHVRMQREDSYVEVVVADTGQGIAPDFLPHVFERFRQADGTTTRAHGGLGLGLAIVKHLVELHGGSIEAHSGGDGLGAAFTVRIPVAPLRAAKVATPTPVGPSSLSSSPSFDCPPALHGLHVLVVDDEPDARELLRSVLESCGAHVRTAASAAEAFDEVTRDPPAVMVSDIGMPREDGYSLIRRIRALSAERGGRTPAVALTAYARMEDRTRALMSGFNSHVAKPVEPHELVVVIANVAGRFASPDTSDPNG